MGISASSSYCECHSKNPLFEFNSLDSPEMKILIPKSNSFDIDDEFNTNIVHPLIQQQQQIDEDISYNIKQRRRTIASTTTPNTPTNTPNHSNEQFCTKCNKRIANQQQQQLKQSPPRTIQQLPFEEINSPKSSKTPKKLTFSNQVSKIFNFDCNTSPSSLNNKFFTRNEKIEKSDELPIKGIRNRRGSTPGREESQSDLNNITRSRSRSSPQPNQKLKNHPKTTSKSLDFKENRNVKNIRNNEIHSDSDGEKDLPPLKINQKFNEQDGIVIGYNNITNSSNGTSTSTFSNNSINNLGHNDSSNDIDVKQPLRIIINNNNNNINNISSPTSNNNNKQLMKPIINNINSKCELKSQLEIIKNNNNNSRSDLILKKRRPSIAREEEQDIDVSILKSSLNTTINSNNSINNTPNSRKKAFNLFKFKSDIVQGNERLPPPIKYHVSQPTLEPKLNEPSKIVVDLNGAAPNVGGKKLPIYVIPPTSPSKSTLNTRSKGITLTEEKKRKLGSCRRPVTTKKKTSKKMFSW